MKIIGKDLIDLFTRVKMFPQEELLNRISGDYRKLGEARLGLSRRAGNVSSLIKNVPQKLKNDPGLIYERMRWRRKAKLDTAGDLLLNSPKQIENVRNCDKFKNYCKTLNK